MKDATTNYVQSELLTADGRRIVLWQTPSRDSDAEDTPVVVLGAGYGQRMHHYAALAEMLSRNGLRVIRYDALNHPGMSDGDMLDFTLSDGLISLEVVLAHTRENYPESSIGLVGTSISGRIAIRALVRTNFVTYCLFISGVVNLQETLLTALETDYLAMPWQEVPEVLEVEGHDLHAKEFCKDVSDHDWRALDVTRDELKQSTAEIAFFHGTEDDWVNPDTISEIVEQSNGRFVQLKLIGGGHDINRNAKLARSLSKEVVRFCRSYAGLSESNIVEPSFGELLKAGLAERREQRAPDA